MFQIKNHFFIIINSYTKDCAIRTICSSTLHLNFAQQNIGHLCDPTEINCDPNSVYYSPDGSCNNLRFSRWAQTSTPYTRFVPANYADGNCAVRTEFNGTKLPTPRVIRNTIVTNQPIPSKFNILFYAFAQWVDHDAGKMQPIVSSQPCCNGKKTSTSQLPDECLPINCPKDDAFYSRFGIECLELKRAINTNVKGCNGVKPCAPINFQSGVFDLSILYGPNELRAKQLRQFSNGLLKTQNLNGDIFAPFTNGDECPNGGIKPGKGSECSVCGDTRVDQNPEIYVMETIFLRVHNYIASKLSNLNTKWNDERVYQEARRILIALFQHVIYSEHLPLLIGIKTCAIFRMIPTTQGYANTYDDSLNPQTIVEYAFSAGRTTHSMCVGSVPYTDGNGKSTSYLLRDKYFNQGFLCEKDAFLNIISTYLNTPSSKQDIHGDTEINNWLFRLIGDEFGQDLAAIDIIRGRDGGIPPYNQIRQACGLCPLHTFEQFEQEVADPQDIPKLKLLYKDINNVDFYVAGMMEKPVEGSLYGPTVSCILGEAFYRWKIGDRLHYEFPTAKFTSAQLQQIKKVKFAWFLSKSLNLTSVQQQSFLLPSHNNRVVNSKDIIDINLNLWKDSKK